MPQHPPGSEHRKLRIGCGAGGGAEDRNVFAAGRVDQPVVKIRHMGGTFTAHRGELVGFEQTRVVVFAHAARIGIDDVADRRDAVAQRQQLVDLLFVFGEYQSRLAIVEQIGGFLLQHVAIQPERQGADGVRGDFGGHPVRPVVTDDADHVAAAEPEFDHAEREVAHPALVVVPAEGVPQPEVFFAQRDLAAMFAGIEPQQLGIGIGLVDPAGVVHHAALSAAAAGVSSGSTSASSSSPR